MFFSVKTSTIIGGRKFRNCVCYPLTDFIKSAVEELVAKGKASIYTERRFFCNGKLVKTKAEKDIERKEAKKAEKKAKKEAEAVKEIEVEADSEVEGF